MQFKQKSSKLTLALTVSHFNPFTAGMFDDVCGRNPMM